MKELIYSEHRRFFFLVVLALSALPFKGSAQVKFPYPVYNNDTLLIKSKFKTKKITADADTFWIMKNSQYKNALIFAKKYKANEELVVEYRKEIELLKEKSTEQDSLIHTFERDRDFYKGSLSDCESDITEFQKKCKTQKLISRFAVIAVPVAFGLGFLLAR